MATKRKGLPCEQESSTNVREHPEKKEKDLSLQLLCIFLLSNDTKKSDTFLSLYKSGKEPWAQAMFSLTCSKLHRKHPWPTASLQCKNLSVLCFSPRLFLQKTSKQRNAKVVFYRLVEHCSCFLKDTREFISQRIMRITLLSVCKGEVGSPAFPKEAEGFTVMLMGPLIYDGPVRNNIKYS